MQSVKNVAYVASAGSGKTTQLVEDALLQTGRVLLTTYTEENVDQIRTCFIEKCGHIPPHVSIRSWFSVLLQDGVRPYQNQINAQQRARSIDFESHRIGRKKADYFTKGGDIYVDKVAEFAYECDVASQGMITDRLHRIYNHIYIDELQDLAGYDLLLVERLLTNGPSVTVAGDPRQGTFSTNNAAKYKQYRKSEIYAWLTKLEKAQLLKIVEKVGSHRCNQAICDFADKLYPEMPSTKSHNAVATKHDGIFQITVAELPDYVSVHKPVCLRYRKDAQTFGISAINIGLSKGRSYDRVLIFPTKPMRQYLLTGDVSAVGDKSKLYIAVTRARYSVAFVISD